MLVFNDPTRVSMQMGNGLISFTLLDLDAARDSGLEFMCASFHMFSSIVILMVNGKETEHCRYIIIIIIISCFEALLYSLF